MVPEIIRWQTPLAHMRRTALEDFEFGGKTIKKGDKVVMWYVSGNRDEDVIEHPYDFIIDRDRPRPTFPSASASTVASATGWPRCSCSIVWEEILKRCEKIEVVGEPERVRSSFVKGYDTLPVRIVG